MSDDRGRDSGELSVQLPAQARLSGMKLEAAPGMLQAFFTDGDSRTISANSIATLCGASIRTEMISLEAERHTVPGVIFHAATSYRSGSTQPYKYSGPSLSSENASLVFALRTAGPGELLYLMADSFNFRAVLGPEAGYSTEMNLRTLVRRLAAFAPSAAHDAFVDAIIGHVPLPPPVASLMEFFRTAARA
ncbi:MAG: hypothetical protein JO347_01590 [Candidatus Eremiobacteraeota bacterium]|nr:hypothetical protein [Candidatus Eremiobacteraeota bacterium]MBV8280738.1 hypothetical protein [Candidatus Eremiobacteraeota bacterium]